jgi:uncharacterized oxidoreductase
MPMRRVPQHVMQAFAEDIFRAAGSEPSEARLVAAHLVEASLLGHDSHGVIRISKYIEWVRVGKVVPNQHAHLVTDRGALAVIDGNHGYGQVIGKEAMELAAERALAHGMASIAIRNSGHLGRIGAWPEMLARLGLASVHFVNTSGFGILVAPHGGKDRRLSANPIAAGVPVSGGAPLVLDIATSAIAEGKIQVARNKREQLPPGMLLDGHGRPTTDPEAFYADPPGAILPFGGHKGSGLSFFCEVLAGSLSGGFASNPQSATAGRLVNNMLSLVFDPSAFGSADAFAKDVTRLVGWIKSTPPIEPGGKVLLPGETEEQTRSDRRVKGLPIDGETWRKIKVSAASLGVAIPKV